MTYFRNHARCSSTLFEVAQLLEHRVVGALGARHLRGVHLADELRVVGDRGPVQRLLDVVCLPPDADVLALRELVGFVGRQARPADEGVQRERRVHVRLAEVGLLQWIVRHGRLELLDVLRDSAPASAADAVAAAAALASSSAARAEYALASSTPAIAPAIHEVFFMMSSQGGFVVRIRMPRTGRLDRPRIGCRRRCRGATWRSGSRRGRRSSG